LEVERDQEGLGERAGEDDGGGGRQAARRGRGRRVEADPGDAAEELGLEAVPQRPEAAALLAEALGGGAERGGEAGDPGDVLGAGPTPLFLPAAGQQGGERDPLPDEEDAGPLRPAELVRGRREEVDPERADVDG